MLSRQWKRAAFLLALGGSLALALWATVFSRFGSDMRFVYAPFWSYREIANGNLSVLAENIGNVLLFIPVGLLAAGVLRFNLPKSVLLGFAVSLAIECCQWLFWLGSFECDDLLHNTLGALIGAGLILKTASGRRLPGLLQKRDLLITALLAAAVLAALFCGQWIHAQPMRRFAAMSNPESGKENLLVLNGKDGRIEGTDAFVSYCGDGSIRVDGSSEKDAWFILGKITLSAGTYRFSGFRGTPEPAFTLKLESLNKKACKFIRFIALESEGETVFSLERKTRLRLVINVDPGAAHTAVFRPAIYREG